MQIALTPEIFLRPATLEDAPALASVLATMDERAAPTELEHQAMRETLIDMARYPDFCAYLLFERDQLVGSFSLMVFPSPSHHGFQQALLDGVAILPEKRGQGLGEMMIRQAMRLASDKHCYKLMLSSNLKRVAAHRFYENLGFTQHGLSFSIEFAAN